MKVKVCVLQFKREPNFLKTVEKARKMLEKANNPDFALIGGEFSLKESVNIDPYPAMQDLATSFKCNIIAPINANRKRFPDLQKGQKGLSSTHIFNRRGEVVGIQDKQHFYWKEKGWFRRGTDINIFNVDEVKIGFMRGLDLLYPDFSQSLKEADLISVSTMAIDNMMLNLAKVRVLENQTYLIMSSFIGEYVGMDFIGNAAIIEPNIHIDKKMRMVNDVKILRQISEEGLIESDLDINYIRKIKKEYQMDEF